MRRVRCVSPHGGGHHGLDYENRAVQPGHEGPLAHPPNEGGYVWNGVLGTVAVGAEVDAPDDFICDGFHFVDAATGAGDGLVTAVADPPQSGGGGGGGGNSGLVVTAGAASLADLLSKGDS